MCINANTSNCIAVNLMSAGCFIGGGAWAGSMFGPVGVGGGAIYGATAYGVGEATMWACKKIFNSDSEVANKAAKIIPFVIGILAGIWAGMLALSLTGVTITFGSAVALMGYTLIPGIIFMCCVGDPEAIGNGETV